MIGSSNVEYRSWNFFSRSGFSAPTGCIKYPLRLAVYTIREKIEAIIAGDQPLKDHGMQKDHPDSKLWTGNQQLSRGKQDTAQAYKIS